MDQEKTALKDRYVLYDPSIADLYGLKEEGRRSTEASEVCWLYFYRGVADGRSVDIP